MRKWEWWLLAITICAVCIYSCGVFFAAKKWTVKIVKFETAQKMRANPSKKLATIFTFKFVNQGSDLTNRRHLLPLELKYYQSFPEHWTIAHLLNLHYSEWKTMYQIAPQVLRTRLEKKVQIIPFFVQRRALKTVTAATVTAAELKLITKVSDMQFNQELKQFLQTQKRWNWNNFRNWKGKQGQALKQLFKRLKKQVIL